MYIHHDNNVGLANYYSHPVWGGEGVGAIAPPAPCSASPEMDFNVQVLIQNLPMSLFLLSTAYWGQRSADHLQYIFLCHPTMLVRISGKVLREVKVHLYQQCVVAVLSAHAHIYTYGEMLRKVRGHT